MSIRGSTLPPIGGTFCDMRYWAWISAGLATAIAFTAPLQAKFQCRANGTDDWLHRSMDVRPDATVDQSLILPVNRNVGAAIRILKSTSAVALKRSDVGKFSDAGIGTFPDRELRPYLIRAVFPTPNPKLEVSRSAKALHIFAGGLGCFAFTKHPVIVFLYRKPQDVFVEAAAAL